MRSRFLLVLTVLTSTTLLGAAARAEAAAEPAVSVIGGMDLVGHGYGHGRGMSQYGAQGRAIKGLKAASILSFYYPGTTLSTTSGDIKVWLKGDIDADTIVLPKAGLSIADFGAGKVYRLPTTLGAKAWKLSGTGSSSGFKVSYQNNGWHSYLPGGKALVGYGEFRTTSYTVTVRMPGGDKTYRGSIQRRNSHTINRTGMDSYVKGVLAVEMFPSWRLEALKAQAIAARSFAAFNKLGSSGPADTWNVDDTTQYQVYGGLGAETTKTNQAVTETAGKILKYGGQPAYTQFSSNNGGWTAGDTSNNPKPYLNVIKADTFEQYSGVDQTWNYSPSQSTLQTKLKALAISSKYATDIGTLQSVSVRERDGNGGDWGGRVLTIRLTGTKTFVDVSGADFRTALSLRSTWFQPS